MKALLISITLAWVSMTTFAGYVQAGEADKKLPVNWPEGGLPEPYASKSASNPPRIITRPADAQLEVPRGFIVEDYLSGLASPRFMILGSNNEILLSETYHGKVYVIQDHDQNKGQNTDKNRIKKLLLEDLENPYGLALYKNWLYVAETRAVKRYKYDSENASVISKGEVVVDMSGLGGGHVTRTIEFDHAAGKFYLSVGSKSNVNAGEPALRAAVSRYNADGSGHEIFATGIRNGVGLRLDKNNQLWVTAHERDALGDDLVPDYFTSVNQGDFFGWPFAYIGPHEDPGHKNAAPDLVAKTRYPDVLLGAHVGALDFIFYSGDQFPEDYHGGAFVALHGSWNRKEPVGYKLVFIPFRDGKPTAGPQDFLTGWKIASDQNSVWGRPVGLLELPDGSMLVSDDGAGKIWRISYSN